MDRKLFVNYIYNILFQVTKFALTFFLVPYTMGHLGESILGISDYASSICGWFVLVGLLGVSTYGIREIGKVRDNKEKLSLYFSEIFIMQLCNIAIVFVLFVLYIELFVTDNKMIYLLYCINIIGFGMDITWFYYGIENFKIVSIRNIIVKLISVVLTIAIVKEPADLWKFVLINTSTNLITQAYTYLGLKKYITFKKVSIKQAYKNHFLGSASLFIPTIPLSIYVLLNQTMLGAMIDDKGSVALFKTAQSFITMFLYFITSIGSVVMPRIANVYTKEDSHKEINKYINSTFNLAIILSIPMMFAMMAVSPNFFPWYLPLQSDAMIKLVQFSCPIIVLISITDVFGTQYLIPTGRTKDLTISVVVGFVVNILVNLITIRYWKEIGATIGYICAEITIAVVQWTYVKENIRIHYSKTLIKSLVSSIVMSLAVLITGSLLESTIVNNMIQAIIGLLVYVIMMLILRENMILRIKSSIFNRNNRENNHD